MIDFKVGTLSGTVASVLGLVSLVTFWFKADYRLQNGELETFEGTISEMLDGTMTSMTAAVFAILAFAIGALATIFAGFVEDDERTFTATLFSLALFSSILSFSVYASNSGNRATSVTVLSTLIDVEITSEWGPGFSTQVSQAIFLLITITLLCCVKPVETEGSFGAGLEENDFSSIPDYEPIIRSDEEEEEDQEKEDEKDK